MIGNSNPNRGNASFIDNLDEEKWVTTPSLKELARKASSRIEQDPDWAGHIFSLDGGRISGVVLYNTSVPTVCKQYFLAVDSNNSCNKDT